MSYTCLAIDSGGIVAIFLPLLLSKPLNGAYKVAYLKSYK